MRRLSLFTLVVLLSFVCPLGSSARADENAKLQSVTVTFHTPGGDNKDHDTKVAVWVASGDTAIAKQENVAPDTEFKDPSDNGPYDLPVQTAVAKSTYRASSTTMLITPNGHDTWITNVVIEAKFADGETLRSESGRVTVNQDHRSATFANKAR